MKTKDLKLTSASYVIESKMSKSAKLQMLNFIQNEASDYQLMALLLDGKIIELNEQEKKRIKIRFENNKLVIGYYIFLAAVSAAAIVYDRITDKPFQMCKKIKESQDNLRQRLK